MTISFENSVNVINVHVVMTFKTAKLFRLTGLFLRTSRRLQRERGAVAPNLIRSRNFDSQGLREIPRSKIPFKPQESLAKGGPCPERFFRTLGHNEAADSCGRKEDASELSICAISRYKGYQRLKILQRLSSPEIWEIKFIFDLC